MSPSPGSSLPILAHIFSSPKKKDRGHSAENARNANIQQCRRNKKRTICVFKCWLSCQVASSSEALCGHFTCKKNPSTLQRRRGARSLFCLLFLRPVAPKQCPSKLSYVFFVAHRRNMSSKRNFVVTERCFIVGGTEKRPRRTLLVEVMTPHVHGLTSVASSNRPGVNRNGPYGSTEHLT